MAPEAGKDVSQYESAQLQLQYQSAANERDLYRRLAVLRTRGRIMTRMNRFMALPTLLRLSTGYHWVTEFSLPPLYRVGWSQLIGPNQRVS